MHIKIITVYLVSLLVAGCSDSNPFAAPPPASPPEAPSDLNTRADSYDKIVLNWVDNGVHETTFHIERSDDGVTYTHIADVPGDTEEYLDSGLSIGNYVYRVNASNDEGYSDYSNTSPVRLWHVDACLETPANGTADLSGHFFEMPISGLNYVTPNQTSFTGANGNFFFGTDSYTQFYLGYTPIGTVLNAPLVRYSDLARSLGARDYRDPIALNLLRLLQTLDTDNDPFNGIQLPCEISTLPYRKLDFTLGEQAFADQTGMAELINWKPMVSTLAAKQRFDQMLKSYYAGTYSLGTIFYIDGYIPVEVQLTMLIDAQGNMVMEGLEDATVSDFSYETGEIDFKYLDFETLLAYFILKDIYGLNIGSLYPYQFGIVAAIQPNHSVTGEATLYTLQGNYDAPIQGIQQ